MRLPAASASSGAGGWSQKLLLVRSPYTPAHPGTRCSTSEQHILKRFFFHNAGTNYLLTILSLSICRMSIKVVSDWFQSLKCKLTFSNLTLIPRKGGIAQASYGEESHIHQPWLPKSQAHTKGSCPGPTCTRHRMGKEQRDQVTCTRICWCCPTGDVSLTDITGVTPHLPVATCQGRRGRL